MEIAVSCDMVVAAENAKFGCTEVGLGIIASTGGLVRLARDINRKDCMESSCSPARRSRLPKLRNSV